MSRTPRPRSPVPDPDEYDEDNILEPYVGTFIVARILAYTWKRCLVTKILARIALSCHSALDILCDKE